MNPAEIALLEAAFEGIVKIIQAVESAKAGKTDPNVAFAAIKAMTDGLAANNATADAELAAKFPAL